jgi:hypothetical protein
MAGIESPFFAAILVRVAFCQHVSCVEGLVLANSLIDGTVAQVDLVEWKATHIKNRTHDDSFDTLGWRYWQIFC